MIEDIKKRKREMRQKKGGEFEVQVFGFGGEEKSELDDSTT